MSDNLLPCPFCGGTETTIADTGVHWVSCLSCDAEGTYRDSEEDAIAAWNTRVHAPSGQQPTEDWRCPDADKPDEVAAAYARSAMIDKIDSAGMRGARKEATANHASMMDWRLSDDAKARIAEIESHIVRPGDPRLDQIVGGPQPPRSAATTVEPAAWIAFNSNGDRTGLSWDIDDTKHWKSRGWIVRPLSYTPTTSPEPATCKDSLQVQSSPEPDAVRKAKAFLDECWEPAPDQIVTVLLEVTSGTLRDMLTYARWKDGIDITCATYAAEKLAQRFGALAVEELAKRLAALSAPVAGEWQTVVAPFARAAEDLRENASDGDHIWESPAAMNITAGDLRSAARLLSRNDRRTGEPRS